MLGVKRCVLAASMILIILVGGEAASQHTVR